MRAIVQKVSQASVEVDKKTIASIDTGYMVLLGIGKEDTRDDIDWLSRKIANLRIFTDENGKMNLSIKQVGGEILLVSQFTLYADVSKGNRPGFTDAADPEFSNEMYEKVADSLRKYDINVKTGQFAANMKVSLVNEGPTTIVYDTKHRK